MFNDELHNTWQNKVKIVAGAKLSTMSCRRWGGVELWLIIILNLGTRWGGGSFTPRLCFTPDIHWMGDWGWAPEPARTCGEDKNLFSE